MIKKPVPRLRDISEQPLTILARPKSAALLFSSSSLEKLFAKLRTWYMERDDDASKWAVAYTYEAVNRHNPDRLKAHAAQGGDSIENCWL